MGKNEGEGDLGEDARRKTAAAAFAASSASISLTHKAIEKDRKGSVASLLNQEARQRLDCGRAGAKRVNHDGGFLKLSARSKRERGLPKRDREEGEGGMGEESGSGAARFQCQGAGRKRGEGGTWERGGESLRFLQNREREEGGGGWRGRS